MKPDDNGSGSAAPASSNPTRGNLPAPGSPLDTAINHLTEMQGQGARTIAGTTLPPPIPTGYTGPSNGAHRGSTDVHSVTQQEAYDLARQAGATPNEAKTLAAIAMAESSGNLTAFRGSDPHGGSFGIWQINGANNSDHQYLANPLNNAKAALAVLREQGLNAWGSYTNGSYKQFMSNPVIESPQITPAAFTTPAATAAPGSAGSSAGGSGAGLVKTVLDAAYSYMGTPYQWGGNEPGKGLDCSGLVQQAYKAAGIDLPRVADQQSKSGQTVAPNQAQPGDLVSWDTNAHDPNGTGADHIGIYIGGGQVIVAPHAGANVQVEDVSAIGSNAVYTRPTAVASKGAAAYTGLPQHGGSYMYAAGDNGQTSQGNSITGTSTSGSGVPNFDEGAFRQALANAGFSSAIINHDEGLKQAFQTAVAKQQSVQDFLAAIQNTHWFQSRSGSQRQYDEDNVADHNSLSARVAAQAASITAQARQLGVAITPLRAHDLAVTALRNGLSPDELRTSLASEAQAYSPTAAYGGTYGAAVDQIKKSMADYNVQLDDKTIGQLAQQSAAGSMDPTKIDEFLRQQASAKYPWLKPQLDQGFTVYQLQSPYRQELANSLEVDPGTISSNDPLLQQGMQMSDGKGGYSTMPLYQFQQAVKSDPRWLKTNNARNSLMDVGVGVLKDMGLTPQ